MREAASDPAAGQWRSSTVRVAPVVAMVGLSIVLLVAPTSGGYGAAHTIGIVLTEALALYIGYGAVTRVAGPPVRGLLVSD